MISLTDCQGVAAEHLWMIEQMFAEQQQSPQGFQSARPTPNLLQMGQPKFHPPSSPSPLPSVDEIIPLQLHHTGL